MRLLPSRSGRIQRLLPLLLLVLVSTCWVAAQDENIDGGAYDDGDYGEYGGEDSYYDPEGIFFHFFSLSLSFLSVFLKSGKGALRFAL